MTSAPERAATSCARASAPGTNSQVRRGVILWPMLVQSRLLALVVLSLAVPAAGAVNRCVTASGRIIYTDNPCESMGAKLERQMKGEPARPAGGVSQLTVCYDPKNARAEVADQVDGMIRRAAALWNGGCGVRFEFVGLCSAASAVHRVYWRAYGSLQFDGKSLREHAVAAAAPDQGVGINLDMDGAVLARRLRRSMVHEFGHLVGIGHLSDANDVMYPGGTRETPTANDFAACKEALGRGSKLPWQ